MKNLLVLLFLVRVTIPLGLSVTYKDVKAVWSDNNCTHYILTLFDDRKIWVPAMWTIIEEK